MKPRNYRNGIPSKVGDRIVFISTIPNCAIPRESLEIRQCGVLEKFCEVQSGGESAPKCLFRLESGGALALSADDESVKFISRG